MDLVRYQSPEQYREFQERGNANKLSRVWVREDNIRMLSEYLLAHVSNLRFGICHGTRRGNEQAWFRQYTGAKVIGTEIASTATQFPDTIQWDFHKVKPEWVGAVDFVYSNSLDHSHHPVECVAAWMSCLRPGGVCILEWSRGSLRANRFDPFSATEAEYWDLFRKEYRIAAKFPGKGYGGTCQYFVLANWAEGDPGR